MSDTCPVCGKGELLDSAPFLGPVKMPVSHLDCVRALQTREDCDYWKIRAEQAEAEVERLNRQRCKTCALMTYMECPVWPAIHRAGFTPPPDDFACNRWEARHD